VLYCVTILFIAGGRRAIIYCRTETERRGRIFSSFIIKCCITLRRKDIQSARRKMKHLDVPISRWIKERRQNKERKKEETLKNPRARIFVRSFRFSPFFLFLRLVIGETNDPSIVSMPTRERPRLLKCFDLTIASFAKMHTGTDNSLSELSDCRDAAAPRIRWEISFYRRSPRRLFARLVPIRFIPSESWERD